MSPKIICNSHKSDVEKNIPYLLETNTEFNWLEKIFEHLTTVAHVCIYSVTFYIIYISCLDFEFFNWHPILYSIGWFCLMTESVLMLTKENVLSQRITHVWRVRCHWLIHIVAMGCSIAGFVVVFLHVEEEHDPHFRAMHGILGLIAMTFALIPTCLSGIPALFNLKLRHIIPPTINKIIHTTSGIITLVVGGVVMVLSIQSEWFKWKTKDNQDIFMVCYISIVFGLVWTLFRPCLTLLQRLRSLMN